MKYPCMVAYMRWLDKSQAEIDSMVNLATAYHAPKDTIHIKINGVCSTIDDYRKGHSVREYIKGYAQALIDESKGDCK